VTDPGRSARALAICPTAVSVRAQVRRRVVEAVVDVAMQHCEARTRQERQERFGIHQPVRELVRPAVGLEGCVVHQHQHRAPLEPAVRHDALQGRKLRLANHAERHPRKARHARRTQPHHRIALS